MDRFLAQREVITGRAINFDACGPLEARGKRYRVAHEFEAILASEARVARLW
jgi:hypothetical protein